jgi:hypothetical protein
MMLARPLLLTMLVALAVAWVAHHMVLGHPTPVLL